MDSRTWDHTMPTWAGPWVQSSRPTWEQTEETITTMGPNTVSLLFMENHFWFCLEMREQEITGQSQKTESVLAA